MVELQCKLKKQPNVLSGCLRVFISSCASYSTGLYIDFIVDQEERPRHRAIYEFILADPYLFRMLLQDNPPRALGMRLVKTIRFPTRSTSCAYPRTPIPT